MGSRQSAVGNREEIGMLTNNQQPTTNNQQQTGKLNEDIARL
ncbi:MAG: hypothetical protein SAJ12_15890 [Jaaginema sp. PMC 1079.18]|nr:hypothetical protein [Jaaginema sp. PMC 1080.18]MEC4852466.1 hypothetical protein [Jaaginema sp. PMC 1079.18]MEC4865841.1 hypothetical protein [Jaaginema sp. PMC 1078.18]